MLGEQVGESRGKRISRRVLSVDHGFEVEVTFEAAGKMLGMDLNELGTYSSKARSDGTLYGEGRGVLMGKDGLAGTWKGQGVGKFVGPGAVSFRGALYFSPASPKLSRLSSVAVVFEFESDAEGNTHTKLWEWK